MLCALYFFLCDIQWHSQVTDNVRVQHEQTPLLRTTMQAQKQLVGFRDMHPQECFEFQTLSGLC